MKQYKVKIGRNLSCSTFDSFADAKSHAETLMRINTSDTHISVVSREVGEWEEDSDGE